MEPSLISEGNTLLAARIRPWLHCFNGALADQRGKLTSTSGTERRIVASMEPSLISEGNGITAFGLLDQFHKLQWSPR